MFGFRFARLPFAALGLVVLGHFLVLPRLLLDRGQLLFEIGQAVLKLGFLWILWLAATPWPTLPPEDEVAAPEERGGTNINLKSRLLSKLLFTAASKAVTSSPGLRPTPSRQARATIKNNSASAARNCAIDVLAWPTGGPHPRVLQRLVPLRHGFKRTKANQVHCKGLAAQP